MKMTVGEAVGLLAYGTTYKVVGAYSGKVYHNSRMHRAEHLDKVKDREVTDSPFFTELWLGSDKGYAYPMVGIWMYDYDLTRGKKDE